LTRGPERTPTVAGDLAASHKAKARGSLLCWTPYGLPQRDIVGRLFLYAVDCAAPLVWAHSCGAPSAKTWAACHTGSDRDLVVHPC
jgi:hypothetical protein